MLQSPQLYMARLLNRRSRNGQSILLIAFAFIALIAFVGIATDVALLFVRYSTLRRAVDAAAIAAAGQVRENATFLTLHAVAEQYMQMHGIQASSVKIETCETEVYDWLQKNPGKTNGDAMDALIAAKSELCKPNPQKLVRVTAQIDSPTSFLSILGWRTVTLQTSSVSQTAVLDVAIVLDTSLSEAYDTRDAEAAKDPLTNTPIYPRSFNGYSEDKSTTPPTQMAFFNSDALKDFKPFTAPPSSGGLGLGAYKDPQDPRGAQFNALKNIRRECWYSPYEDFDHRANYGWGGCCNDPTIQSDAPGDQHTFYIDAGGEGHGYNEDPNWYVYQDPTSADSQIMVTGTNPGGQPAANLLAGGSTTANTPGALAADSNNSADAKGDGNYSDLVCEPFKQVRDAARRFIQRLDFVRGDRVVLVTFDSQAKAIKPYGSSVEIIDNKATAIRTLNMQVGVEVNPNNRQIACQSYQTPVVPGLQSNPYNEPPMDPKYGPGVNPNNVADYWSIAQCPDTNMGGGIQVANSMLVDSRWVRREAVWVMVILSDGYPNRTPALPTGGPSLVGTVARPWLTTTDLSGKPADTSDYCDQTKGSPLYGTKPEYCTGWGLPGPSFGFCPGWTYDPTGPNPAPAWNPGQKEPAVPYCVDNDPDSRHFCMDTDGNINPKDDPANPYYCDTHYDAEDYAKDRADFAGLINYTKSTKGNFIAMYSIFFDHQSNNSTNGIGINILGVKMLRYIADAGDNGIIDNHLQRWYRDVHDGKFPSTNGSVTNPPTGILGAPSKAGQPVPPTYDGSNAYFTSAPFSYPSQEDPCAQYDYSELHLTPADGAAYEAAASQSCGQFYYAKDKGAVNKAFLEIASRLFTRLSR